MNKEALKLGLEALAVRFSEGWHDGIKIDASDIMLLSNAAEALAQPELEPIGQLCEESYGRGQVMWFNKPVDGSYVYATPPQRTWVGLTDEEIEQGYKESWVTKQAWQSAVWWAEAKLKEKNT